MEQNLRLFPARPLTGKSLSSSKADMTQLSLTKDTGFLMSLEVSTPSWGCTGSKLSHELRSNNIYQPSRAKAQSWLSSASMQELILKSAEATTIESARISHPEIAALVIEQHLTWNPNILWGLLTFCDFFCALQVHSFVHVPRDSTSLGTPGDSWDNITFPCHSFTISHIT